jgi:dehydrogenase/reductase SDR family protein 12
VLDQLALGLRFYLGFAPKFSRLGFKKKGLHRQPVDADFAGQTWLISGASGGIGEAIALQAASRGARIIALARSHEKLDLLAEKMPDGADVHVLAADLSLQREVREAVDTLAEEGLPIDVLVNNVGVLLNEHSLTAEGFETSYATNLLNHYVLTESLLAKRVLADQAVLINMSSGGMYSTTLLPNRLNITDPQWYDGVKAYARHKRAQVELTHHWNGLYGDRITAHVMHPGWVDTIGVQTSLPSFRRLFRPILRNADQGADTALWLAASRPEAAAAGIWLDRELQPEHVGPATHSGLQERAALVALLDADGGFEAR